MQPDADVVTELRTQVGMLQAQIDILTAQAERDRGAVELVRAERDERDTMLKIVEDELRHAVERAGRAEGELAGLRRRGWLARLLG
jgi:signal transduction histidine kinase